MNDFEPRYLGGFAFWVDSCGVVFGRGASEPLSREFLSSWMLQNNYASRVRVNCRALLIFHTIDLHSSKFRSRISQALEVPAREQSRYHVIEISSPCEDAQQRSPRRRHPVLNRNLVNIRVFIQH